MQAFSGYVMTGQVSRLQMIFLFLTGLGLVLSGLAYFNQAKKQKIKDPNLILILHFAVSIMLFSIASFGLTSQLGGTDFWAETTFEEIQSALLFNSLTLSSFLLLGTLQLILFIIFFKTKMLQQHQLLKAAKYLSLTSAILLIIKSIIDYPLIKESIFVLSYMLKIPFPNNIISIITPLIYLSAQIPITIILLHNQKPSVNQ